MSTCPPVSTRYRTCPSTHPPFRGWTGTYWTDGHHNESVRSDMTDDDLETTALVDHIHTARLDDIGQPDYYATVVVRSDGEQFLILAHRASVDDSKTRVDLSTPHAVHEQLGPLPARWVSRIQLAPLRCGRPTARGAPCRVVVRTPCAPCARHHRPADKDVCR